MKYLNAGILIDAVTVVSKQDSMLTFSEFLEKVFLFLLCFQNLQCYIFINIEFLAWLLKTINLLDNFSACYRNENDGTIPSCCCFHHWTQSTFETLLTLIENCGSPLVDFLRHSKLRQWVRWYKRISHDTSDWICWWRHRKIICRSEYI